MLPCDDDLEMTQEAAALWASVGSFAGSDKISVVVESCLNAFKTTEKSTENLLLHFK